MLLALPPGYASAIFPPAGIGVAAALIGGRATIPWLFISSLLLNSWVAYNLAVPASALTPAVLIAFASTLQALAGGVVLRKLLGHPTRLDNSRDLTLFVLSAPLICLVSASLSVCGLVALGTMPSANDSMNWLSWWMGDTLGVLLMLPITRVLFGEPRQLWRPRVTAVALPMTLAFLLGVSGFVVINRWEYKDSLAEFRSLANRARDELSLRFEQQDSLLEQVEGYWVHDIDKHMTRMDFARFVRPALLRFPMIQVVELAPQRMDIPGFEIREWDASGNLVRAAPRDYYIPVS